MAMKSIVIENARITFRNFSGAEGKYNRAGDRNFAVLLDPDIADEMAKDGWNVKYLKPRDEQEDPQAYIQVSVNFKGARPPKVVMVTSRGKSALDESMVGILDWAEFTNVDLTLNPYEWEVNGKTGVKAYLKTIFATLFEDELDLKYADVPDSAANTLEVESYDILEEAPAHRELES